MTFIDIIKRTTAAMAIMIIASGCDILCPDKGCDVDEETRKVLLLYSAGYNSLKSYLLDDINDLKSGWLPGNGCNDDILLVYTHTPLKSGRYDTPSTPYLLRLYKNQEDIAITDTLITYEAGTISASGVQLNNVLTYIKDNFTSGNYGMIFSSHATGYLPAGYYSDPDSYVFNDPGIKSPKSRRVTVPVPYVEPEHDPSLPMVKSIGQDQTGTSGNYLSYEMELAEFAEAIPMHLDYILFDACLMGGVEVAYELRDKCTYVGFSQAEVLAEGFDYKTLTTHLLQKEVPDPQAVCEDYFIQYDIQSGIYRSATISFIDCTRMDALAETCRNIFNAHRSALAEIDPSKVQRFYRYQKHWFYDLESIAMEAGATEAELAELRSALNECVLYKGHTPEFMIDFPIDVFSGLSMYLPCNGGEELDKYYKTLQWNQATGLVQ